MNKDVKNMSLSEIHGIEWEGYHDDITAVKDDYILRVEQMTRKVWWWAVWINNTGEMGHAPTKKKAKEEAIKAYKRL